MMRKLELYFRSGMQYDVSLEAARRMLRKISEKWKVDFVEFDVDQLSSEEQQKLIDDIRSILPQTRGRIVSSRGSVLPLSGGKLLNVVNTPIAVLRENTRAVNVFPHLLGTTYFGLIQSLNRILEVGPSEYVQSRGLLEDPIVKLVSDNPTLVEDGMSFVEANVELPAGCADLVLRDRNGIDVLVEVETKAGDQAVGQVLRLARSHAERMGVKSVRKSIICVDFESNLPLACKEAEIDLLRLSLIKVDGQVRSRQGLTRQPSAGPVIG